MAIRFDASSDGLIRTSGVINYNAAYTVMCWFYMAVNRSTWSDVFSINNNSSNNYDVIGFNNSGNVLNLEANISGTGTSTTGSTLSVTTWYHLAMVRASATDLRAYLNGVQDGSTVTANVGSRSSSSRMEFNNTAGENEWCNMRVAAIKLYDTNLSAAEILNEMRYYVPIRTTNLHIWTPGLAAGQVEDHSGGGRNWTTGGSLATEDGPPISWRRGKSRIHIPAPVVGGGGSKNYYGGGLANANRLRRGIGWAA